tara:strand:- start:89 stop:427 length:339 start_codon:yes stop_codon:yes gene_type:complete
MLLEKLLNNALNSKADTEEKKEKSYYGKAKRLAKKLGLTIEIENIRNGFGEPVSKGSWIEGTGWEDGNFSTSWEECYDNLLVYQDELSQRVDEDKLINEPDPSRMMEYLSKV